MEMSSNMLFTETVKEWGFELTTVDFRKNELVERIAGKHILLSDEEDTRTQGTVLCVDKWLIMRYTAIGDENAETSKKKEQ